MKILAIITLFLGISQICISNDTLDGTEWLQFDTKYTGSQYGDTKNQEVVELRELPFSRFHYATSRLEENKWFKIEEDLYETFLLSESDIPGGTTPYLVRAVIKFGAGSHFDVHRNGNTIKVRHQCLIELEDKIYKCPLIVFLESSPENLEVHNHELGW